MLKLKLATGPVLLRSTLNVQGSGRTNDSAIDPFDANSEKKSIGENADGDSESSIGQLSVPFERWDFQECQSAKPEFVRSSWAREISSTCQIADHQRDVERCVFLPTRRFVLERSRPLKGS